MDVEIDASIVNEPGAIMPADGGSVEALAFLRRDRRRRRQPARPAKERQTELGRRAEVVHKELVARAAPFRFCVYREQDRVMIDVVTLDKKGRMDGLQSKDITQEESDAWMKRIDEQIGLIIDATV